VEFCGGQVIDWPDKVRPDRILYAEKVWREQRVVGVIIRPVCVQSAWHVTVQPASKRMSLHSVGRCWRRTSVGWDIQHGPRRICTCKERQTAHNSTLFEQLCIPSQKAASERKVPDVALGPVRNDPQDPVVSFHGL
jgi:hypothetical protein